MRSRFLFGLTVSSGLLLMLSSAIGCSDDNTNTNTTGSGGSGGGTSSSSSSSSSSGKPFVADPNISCDEGAIEIILGDSEYGDTLDIAEDDRDYFTFQATASDALAIITDAKPTADEFDATYPDLVITLKVKDASGNWVDIAQNDDPYPMPRVTNDSAMYTYVKGNPDEKFTFCVEVTECNVLFPNACAPVEDIVFNDYTIFAGKFDPASMGAQAEVSTEPSDDAGAIDYENVQQGTLFRSLGWGTFADDKDVDMWTFTVPDTVKVDPGSRAACHFEFYYPGLEGNGSTADKNVIAYLADAADPATVLAQIDPNIYDSSMGPPEPMNISAPCEPGKQYVFVMKRADGAVAGANDFYFFNHYILTANPVEASLDNGTIDKAEVLTASTGTTEGASYFVDGNTDMDGDVDYYSIDVPSGSTQLSVACESERGGSALRGFKVTPVNDADMPLSAGKGNLAETATKQLFAYEIPIPTGATKLMMKVETTLPQATDIKSNFYRCGFHVRPPTTP